VAVNRHRSCRAGKLELFECGEWEMDGLYTTVIPRELISSRVGAVDTVFG